MEHVNNINRKQAAYALSDKFGGIWIPVYEKYVWRGFPSGIEEAGEVVYKYFFTGDDLEASRAHLLKTPSSPLAAYFPSFREREQDLVWVEKVADNETSVTIFRRA